jgi:biopolymer transport protein ExbB
LLGTVTGMINTFKLSTVFGTGDAKQLSSGISEALITTEFGLVVAIPSLIIHALLNRRSQAVMATMERMAVTFLNGLARKN